jgi:methylated-DNA-[protein]-cysteine S-methyltransferase
MSVTNQWAVYESPLGPLTLRGGSRGLAGLDFPGRGVRVDDSEGASVSLGEALRQLDEYFAGSRRRFDVGLDLGGTPFQRSVWARLEEVPYGTTVSYTALAQALGRSGSVRAVAAAVARTPVPIVIPCHRVLAVDGALTGYVGGTHRKRALLDLERDGTGVRKPRVNVDRHRGAIVPMADDRCDLRCLDLPIDRGAPAAASAGVAQVCPTPGMRVEESGKGLCRMPREPRHRVGHDVHLAGRDGLVGRDPTLDLELRRPVGRA